MEDRPDGPGRVAWIDIAKALAILLVVVFHISVWFSYSVVPAAAGGPAISFWREISNALIPVRIPLFFLVSGVLAHRAVTRTWAELARTRFAGLLWPFALWTVLIALPWSLRVDHADPSANFGIAGAAVVFAGAHFWYLPALVLFLALAKAVRPHPVIALLASVIVSVVIAPLLSPVYGLLGPVLGVNLERWLHFALWFLAGCFFPLVVRRAAEWNAMLVPVGIAGLIVGRWLLINVSSHPAVTLAIGAVGVVTLVIFSRWVARWGGRAEDGRLSRPPDASDLRGARLRARASRGGSRVRDSPRVGAVLGEPARGRLLRPCGVPRGGRREPRSGCARAEVERPMAVRGARPPHPTGDRAKSLMLRR